MNITLEDRVYYVRPEVDSDQFIAIKHGQTGYFESPVATQEAADALNERQGISRVEAEAALPCSMFGCWHNFSRIVESMRGAK